MSDRNAAAIDMSEMVVHLDRACRASAAKSPPGPPVRINGYTIGAPFLDREPPHRGEMHPDGDEILFLLSGAVTVVLEDKTPPREVKLEPGQAIVVPRGVWHRVRLDEPSRLLHITPGPGGEHRLLE